MGSRWGTAGPTRGLTIISAFVCIIVIYMLFWNLMNSASTVIDEMHGVGDDDDDRGSSLIHEHDRPASEAVPTVPDSSKPSAVADKPQTPVHETPAAKAAYGDGPLGPSWSTWFSPDAVYAGDKPATKGGSIDGDWNILYHLGGDGPWVQKTKDVVEGETVSPPKGCEVEQVHMLSRHGERFPTESKGDNFQKIIQKMKSGQPKGALAFLRDWEHFVTDPQSQLSQLTTTGPYAGTLDAFSTGTKLRTRYPNLASSVLGNPGKIKVWAADSERVVESARLLSQGLFGFNKTVDVQVIPETSDRGGNTLTPTDTCLKYQNDPREGHSQGEEMLSIWQVRYLRLVAERIEDDLYDDRKAAQGSGQSLLTFSSEDVFAMQELCAFEINVRGQSPWCDVFTREEWVKFEYARDLYHFYRSGPGNMWGQVLGNPWLNASAQIMANDDIRDPFFLSFTHDTSMVPVPTLLGLFEDERNLNPDFLTERRKFSMTQFVPMGGRIALEKLSCASATDSNKKEKFVRLNVNDGITEIPGCHDGPGHSCAVEGFVKLIEERTAKVGSFREKCGLEEGVSGHIEFLKQ